MKLLLKTSILHSEKIISGQYRLLEKIKSHSLEKFSEIWYYI